MQSQRVYHGRSFYYRNVMIFALAAILLLGLVFSPLQYASALLPGACNCVIFRLDDIQDWWLNSVQNAVMDNFITKQEKVSLGIVMNFVGNDASVVNKVRTGHSQGYFELVSHGWNHVDYSALSLQDQQNTLGQANQKMSSLWGRSTYIFIPPYNTFNNDTQKALQNLGMKVLSSEFDLLAPYVQSNQVFKSQTGSNIKDSFGLYELPQQVGFYNYDFDPPHKNSIDTIMNQVTNRINSHGYAVVTLHPQDFAVKDSKQVPLNQVSSAEIADLNTLITNIHSAGFSIKSYTQVSGIPLPPIVDNTPPVLTPPADKTVISSQPITTVNLGTPTVTDNVDPSPIVTNNAPAAGFPQGTTAVVWNATDHTGNTRLATQYVTIRSSADNIKPLITTTSPPSGTISGPASGLNIRVTGTASDAETGIKIVEVRTNTLAYAIANKTSPDSWSNWSKVLRFTSPTSTTIVARATDFWGNQQWSNTPITVTLSGPDTTPPQVTAPPNITTEATSAETPVYTGTATAFDNSDPAPVISSNGPGSGESAGFPLGTTVITWTARDAAGNVGTATQTITIVDTTAPAVPDPLLPVNGTHSSGGPVNFDWSDEVDAVSNVKYDLLVANNTAFNSPIVQQTGLVNSTYTSTALPSGTYFWKVRSADASGNHSPYSNTLTFTVDSSAPTVTASPSSGTYNSTQSVSLTASEPSTIYYTTNGSTPTTSSTVYSTPISISNSTTLKFFAVDTANNASPVVTETYTFDTSAPTVTASPAGGLYNSPQSVTLTASEPSTIYYTTNGSTPTTSSSTYSTPISISTTTDLKFFAKDAAGNTGSVVTQSYIFDTVAPTVTASPPGGLYNSTQSVTLTASKPGSTIYYTTNGSTPTQSSPVYSSPIAISSPTDLKFFAKDTIGNVGSIVTETYSFDTTAPTVTAAPPAGTYNTAQSVSLTASEPATIYYTTDGSTPTTSSTVYSGAIAVSTDTSLKYFAVDTAGNAGPVETSSYIFDTASPTVTASPPGGIYATSQSITLAASEPANIHYTTDGSTPTTSSPLYVNPIAIASDTTLKFIAIDLANNTSSVVTETYTIDSSAPTVIATPGTGVYNSPQSVALAASEPATIYYTTDGSTPTTSSTVYSGAIAVSTDTSLKYFAVDTAGNAGPVETSSYIFDTASPTVTASPPGGTYTTMQNVTLTPSEPSTIYFTTDGSTPTTSSTIYSTPISISTTTTLKFFAVDTAGNIGSVATQAYVIDSTAPTVTASPPGGTYNSTQSVTLTASKPGSTIHYTTDGSTPTQSSPVYSTPLVISSDTTLKFFAVDGLGNVGSVVTEVYSIDTTAPTVTASPAGGLYNATQSVTLTASKPNSTIHFTTDGSTPTASSATYTAPISITQTLTLKFFAIDSIGNAGPVVTETYTIDSSAPTVTASPPGGTYNTAQSVSLTASEPSTIYFTTDGSTPTTSSSTYSTPISISTTTALKYFAKDAAGNTGSVVTQSYVFDTVAPTVTASPAGDTYNTAQSVTLTASKPGSTIYYTTNGSTPTTSSTVYSTPISISNSTTLKFFAVDTANNASPVVTETYTFDTSAPTVTASPPAGTYSSAQSITLTASEPSTIYYTTDGSTPTTSSTIYSTPISISTTTTLKFFGKDTAGNAGTVASALYTIQSVSFPITHMSDTTATLGQSTWSGQQSHVEFASPTSQLVGKSIDQITLKLRKVGTLTGQAEIGVFNADVSVKKLFGTVTANTITSSYTDYTFSLPNNELYTIQSGDRIGIKYTGGTASSFIAVMLDQDPADPFDGTNSYRQQYTTSWSSSAPNDMYMILKQTHGSVDTIPPTVTAFPAGGPYNSAQSVTLSADEPATIYYTLDGSTPTQSSPVYSSPLAISDTTTLKFFGKDTAGNTSPVKTEVYTIQPAAFPVTHMSDTTATYGLATNSGQQSHVEFVSPTSQLVGKSIDQITMKLRRTGTPAGTIEVGVFNLDLSVKKSFGTMNASAVASSYTDYTFSLANSELYTIASGDNIGIKYTGGDSSNFIAVMVDHDSADPFDGANSYRQQYNTSWSSYPTDDLYMVIKQTHS